MNKDQKIMTVEEMTTILIDRFGTPKRNPLLPWAITTDGDRTLCSMCGHPADGDIILENLKGFIRDVDANASRREIEKVARIIENLVEDDKSWKSIMESIIKGEDNKI